MRMFLDLPIRRKLTAVIILANAVALLLAGVATMLYENSLFRKAAEREASILADLIGTACGPALAKNNAADAQSRLHALQNQKQILTAQLFTRDGQVFAEYVHDRKEPPQVTSLEAGYELQDRQVSLVKPLYVSSQPVGTLVLRMRVDELKEHLHAGFATVAAALVISTLVAWMLILIVQRTISNPLRNLNQLVKSVEAENDYGLRATKQGNDEIGDLIDGFNRMLEQIQQHETSLQASQERFRQVMESIQEVFWMRDVSKQQLIYVSPRYEQIWGRSCASLYKSPQEWADAIHHDDRERVLRAFRATHADPDMYDEEFRIVRPDGSIRWIRDRAFPVFDKSGQVYRYAGIAEDITERKRLECEVLEISDREQERIGQDLHDGLCQYLVSIAMSANLLKRRLAGVSNPEARVAEKICSQLEDAIAQARSLARGVSSLDLADDNLSPALHELASAASREYGVPCHVASFEPISFCNPVTTTNLYRIAREAVHNAAKHANPTRIQIELKTDGDAVCLKVKDDGVGIDSIPKNGLGLGLGIMKYRASMIGAELKIEKAAEGGTVMTCNLSRNPI